LDREARRLSGGEARRASLARALCLRAPVVLLDEPLAGLDAPTYERLLDELPHLLRAFNATTFLVTHKREEALRLGQDVVVMVGGRVHSAGDKHDVATSPRDAIVAEMFGYSVVMSSAGPIAVPPGGFRLGPGARTFTLVVEELVDLVSAREVVGTIGSVRVRVPLPADAATPRRADDVTIHAVNAVDLAPPPGIASGRRRLPHFG
jgi:ABC-type glutathione transport system ATPase component